MQYIQYFCSTFNMLASSVCVKIYQTVACSRYQETASLLPI